MVALTVLSLAALVGGAEAQLAGGNSGDSSGVNCCGGGGTWEKACVVTAVKEGQHTWQDGWDACNDKVEIDKKKAKAEEAKAEAAERNG